MSVKHLRGHVDVDYLGDVTVVNFTRRNLVDEAGNRALGEQLTHLAEGAGKGQLLLNFGEVEAMTSLALSQIVSLQRKVKTLGGRLILCNINPPINELFEITRLYDFFHLPAEKCRPQIESPPPGAPTSSPPTKRGWKGHLKRMPIALCDPEPARASRLIDGLTTRHMNVVHFTDLGALFGYVQKHSPAAAVLPLFWRDGAGKETDAEVLHFLRRHGRRLAIIVYAETKRIPIGVYSRALVAGARRVMDERSDGFVDELRHALAAMLLQQQAQLSEEQRLRAAFSQHGLIGQSSALQQVFRSALKATRLDDLPVLILGETGTGKQRLAEAIHKMDPRRSNKAFVCVNCSAINKTLAESELFGHARGAFSGAGGERLGLFRAANGGTLLLDEIGDLSLELQPKLLRVLQERQLLPVGADYEHSIDVRIISATNQSLQKMVAEGKFREDLYQRLNVLQIRIPALRDRPDDIELQACHYLRTSQLSREDPVTHFDPLVMEVLRLLPWEGNTRQLQNMIWEVLARKESGSAVQIEDLPHWILESLAHKQDLPSQAGSEMRADVVCSGGRPLSEVMDEFERRVLRETLARNEGNRTRTATELGLTPRSIFNKIKKHRLG